MLMIPEEEAWVYHLCLAYAVKRCSLYQFTSNYVQMPRRTSGPILGLRPANVRRRYKVTSSLIGWAQN